jgi:starvation-inducible DNA-binding protein
MSATKAGGQKMEINIGINEENREAIADELSKVLADTYMLYLKTHNYHWNVTGELFHSLHEQFEQQYTELADAIDEIAERIRALGYRAPGTFKEFNELTSITEEQEEPEALEMVRRLAVGNEQVLRTAREALGPAKKAEDEATIDLLTERLHIHAKTAWMLRSHLE